MITNGPYLEDAMLFRHAYEDAIYASSTLSQRAHNLALALARICDWKTGRGAVRSNRQLARLCKTSPATISRARGELIAAGFLSVPPGHTSGLSCEHTLLIPDGSRVFNGAEDESTWPVWSGGTLVNLTNPLIKLTHPPSQIDAPPHQIDAHTIVPITDHNQIMRESAHAPAEAATPEQAREADAPLSPEQIGPEQQTSAVTAEIVETVQADVAPPVEVVTAEIVENTRAVEQPPVTGQALMGEGHSKASDTPELPEDMRRLRDELRAGREALAERDRHVASLPGPDVYLAELRELITVEHDLLWRSESAWHQLINNARRDGWTPAQLTERVHWCVVHYATARKAWRPQWLLSDVGRYDEGTAHVLNKAEAQHQRRVIESEGYLGQGQRRHAADLNDVGL